MYLAGKSDTAYLEGVKLPAADYCGPASTLTAIASSASEIDPSSVLSDLPSSVK
jgi:hypothetical protein